MLSKLRIRSVHVAETSSTMDLAKEIFDPQKKDELLAITADQQSSGRGSHGRQWNSAPGNTYLSIAVPKSSISTALLPVFPLVVGLSVLSAVRQFVQRPVPMTKWPNDVLIDRRKVAGCLIEDGGSGDFFVIGIGVNVNVAPETSDNGRATTAIAEHVQHGPVDQNQIAAVCTEELVKNHDRLTHLGRAAVVTEYRDAMDWSCTMYRRLPDGTRGEKVLPVNLLEYGQLVVRPAAGGPTETLLTEYLI